jgi:hypothetical protein
MTDLRALRENHSRSQKRPPQNPSPLMPRHMRTRWRTTAVSKIRSSDTVVRALESVIDDAWTQRRIWLWDAEHVVFFRLSGACPQVNGDRPIPKALQ